MNQDQFQSLNCIFNSDIRFLFLFRATILNKTTFYTNSNSLNFCFNIFYSSAITTE